jgi:endonuclease/exonuclease/phosphatase family metal-dependent hydrolase
MTASATGLRVLTWNLYHGRDKPPDRSLFTLRSRLFRKTEDDGVFVQLNRSLREEFVSVVARAEWSLCLLQEAPPSWCATLARRCGAQADRVLTSRNQLRPLTGALARWNPDLIASWEGGSNTTLVRPPWRIVEGSMRSLLLNPLSERRLVERRRMAFMRVRLAGTATEICVANLHATTRPSRQTGRELPRAAQKAVEWASGTPIVFGGDFNLRPASAPAVYESLERDLGFSPPTAGDAIDHLLVRGLDVLEAPEHWPAERRELEIRLDGGSRRVRLSDHAPVGALFGVRLPRCDTTGVDG